jgi:hypothetical protein
MLESMFKDPPPAFPELEEVIKTAQANLFKDSFLAPVFMYMEKDGQFNVCLITQEVNNDKEKLAATLKILVDKTNPDYHFLITEAWLGRIAKTNEEETNAKLAEVTENGVESMPRSERYEVVVINAADTRPETKGRWLGHFTIIRDKEDIIHNFGPTRWFKMKDEEQLTGRLII